MGEQLAGGELALSKADPEDLPEIVSLLGLCGLPTDDVREIVDDFLIARIGPEFTGTIALEAHGAVGLLRSLAVVPAYRGRGVARALCDAVARRAVEHEMREVYLLTTDAAEYFRRLGFRPCDRREAPEAILQSRECRDLCPASAVLMRKPVDRTGEVE